MTSQSLRLARVAIFVIIIAQVTHAQSTQFTYQGKLTDGGTPASGNFDVQFKLFDSATLGTQQGTTVTISSVVVTSGIFTVSLDFGAGVFTGPSRFLEISVRPAGGGGFTQLNPRQPLTSTPYAIKSLNAAAADGLSVACVSCVTSSQIASAPAGSASSYVQNTTTPQPGADFNISGTGTANIFNAGTQYNIGGNRVLSIGGTDNFFAGVGAGQINTGDRNAFVGRNAGQANTTGRDNAFFGQAAGQTNTTASFNAFFGSGAGLANIGGAENAFFGSATGRFNTSGNGNSFFGRFAGFSNQSGGGNSFVGDSAGANSLGSFNTFFGFSAGDTNTTGTKNTIIGSDADLSTNNLDHATAIGADSVVSASNTVVLGRAADTVQIPGTLNVTGATTFIGTLAANIFNATTQYNIGGFRALSVAGNANTFVGLGTGQANSTGFQNSFLGANAGNSNTTGGNNSFFGEASGFSNTDGGENSFVGFTSGFSNTLGNSNSFFGRGAGSSNTTGSSNTVVGYFANVGANNLTNATALGAGAVVSQSNSLVLGSINVNVGVGTSAPLSRLHLNGNDPNFAVTLTNSANTTGRRGYRLAFDNDRFSFQRADDLGNFADNQMAIDQATGNVGIGTTAPSEKLQVANGNIAWANSLLETDQGGSIELGGTSTIAGSGVPFIDFHFAGLTQDFNARIINDLDGQLSVFSKLRVVSLGSGSTSLCRDGNNVISNCSSSLRYKTDIKHFGNGLGFVNRLNPIAFSWKIDGMKDVGFGAEDVEQISPLFVTYNTAGQVEGVKYDRLSVVFVNAFKEQQKQIESLEKQNQSQQKQLERQQKQIDSLKQIVCSMNPLANLCK